MKFNSFILIFVVFFATKTFAQFNVLRNGNIVSSGHVFNFSSNTFPASKLDLQLTNTSTTSKQYLIRVENLINTSGAMFQICINFCYMGIQVGNTYPDRNDGVFVLNAGATSATDALYFLNVDNVGTVFPMDYIFKIYETDGNGAELGTPFLFTYRYNPSVASVTSLKESTLVSPTFATDVVYVTTDVQIKTTLIDMQGRILQMNDATFNPTIHLNGIAPQTLILVCEDEQGNQFTQKIIKQ